MSSRALGTYGSFLFHAKEQSQCIEFNLFHFALFHNQAAVNCSLVRIVLLAAIRQRSEAIRGKRH